MKELAMRTAIFLALALCAATPALAQEEPKNPAPMPQPAPDNFWQGGGAIPALPLQTQKQGDVTFLNGGVGEEELFQLRSQSSQYNVQVTLSAPDGAYISDVRLRLLDTSGQPLLDIPDAGPYVYAKLAPGKYRLETTNPGEQPKTEKFTAPATGAYKNHVMYQQ